MIRVGDEAPPPAPPAPGGGERLYTVLVAALAPLHVGQHFEIGEALSEGRAWAELPPWVRKIFNESAGRLR